MRKRNKTGRVVIPEDAIIKPHKLAVAVVLSRTGFDVEFLPVRTIPTPDLFFRGLEWEVKSPIGSSSRTIENNLRNALKQSQNIIIDLSRIKQKEEKAIREIKHQLELLRGVGRIIVITKSREVLVLSGKLI